MSAAPPFGTTLAVGDLVDVHVANPRSTGPRLIYRLGRVEWKKSGVVRIGYFDAGVKEWSLFSAESGLLYRPLTGSASGGALVQAKLMIAEVQAAAIEPPRIADLKAQLAAAKQTNAQQQTQHSAQLAAAHTHSAQLEQHVASLDSSLRESRAQSKSQEDQISALHAQLKSSELRCKAAESTLQQPADVRSTQDPLLHATEATDDLQQRVAQLQSELTRSQSQCAQLNHQSESRLDALEQQLTRRIERLEQTAAASVTEHGSAAEEQRAASSSAVSSAVADTHAASSTSLSIASVADQQQSQPEAIDAPLAAEVTSDGALTPPSRSVSAHSDRSSDDEWKVVQTD